MTEEGVLYVASATGVTALAPDGATLFTRALGLVPSGPSLDPRGEIVVGVILGGRGVREVVSRASSHPEGPAARGALVVLDARGAVIGASRVPLSPWSSPLVLDDGSAVVPGSDGVVRRLHAEGPALFELPLGEVAHTAPAELPSGELVLGVGGRVVTFTPDGRLLGDLGVGDSIVAGPAVGRDGVVWSLTGGGVLFGTVTPQGVHARVELGGSTARPASLAVAADGAVWVGTGDGAVRCHDPSGALRFRVDASGVPVAGMTVDASGVALVLDERGGLFAQDPDGRRRWRVETGARTQAPPVLAADGTIYVATLAGTVQAWR